MHMYGYRLKYLYFSPSILACAKLCEGFVCWTVLGQGHAMVGSGFDREVVVVGKE